MGVIESLCRRDVAMTVMAASSHNDIALLQRSMQAGAREFLLEPIQPEVLIGAFERAAARRPEAGKTLGKTLTFIPSKGGSGATTIATNFAVALTKESGSKVVIVDLDIERGEVAAGLGMTASFSVLDGLMNPDRLDREFLATLLLRHTSGLAVLGAPERYQVSRATVEGADKLFAILREEFDYVVVDAAACRGELQDILFALPGTIYLVTETSFPALRNAHRLLSYLSEKDRSRDVEIVLNRFDSRHGAVNERSATKTLARPVNWKIPNSYEAARAAEDSGVPLAMEDSPIRRVLVEMARSTCGKPLTPEKKAGKKFSFFPPKITLTQAES
jgi:pilus assembly protein CpaE